MINSIERQIIKYGNRNLEYNVVFMKRKTIAITVKTDKTIEVKVPLEAEEYQIQKKILKKARWIIKQINYFTQFNPGETKRYYLSGETHLYLGKQYRLKIKQSEKNSIKLQKGYFIINTKENTNEKVKKIFTQWYREKAYQHFKPLIEKIYSKLKKYNIEKPQYKIRKMPKRWGSLTKTYIILLNPELIKAPKECIEYVITHEMCHLIHPNHSKEFYKLLTTLIPQWQKIKHKLEMKLS
ncbi:MAG: M48 family metallopeptidase [Candidatus Muirbacterium halophilum]|nr:M48 family metallopeptidase [Candidatus Muirbacterium halophilum]MCK9474805.1 M48 family metallopeptidase [Candidatus Muirbacterium halophilum]